MPLGFADITAGIQSIGAAERLAGESVQDYITINLDQRAVARNEYRLPDPDGFRGVNVTPCRKSAAALIALPHYAPPCRRKEKIPPRLLMNVNIVRGAKVDFHRGGRYGEFRGFVHKHNSIVAIRQSLSRKIRQEYENSFGLSILGHSFQAIPFGVFEGHHRIADKIIYFSSEARALQRHDFAVQSTNPGAVGINDAPFV
jgi:hypothetical protein